MSADAQDPKEALQQRNVAARVGISLLNLATPGLGLLRLSRWRTALAYVAVQMLVLFLSWAAFASIKHMSFSIYATIFVICIAILLAAYISSIVHSWENSAAIAPYTPWWSRWYGLVAVWLILIVTTWSIPDLLKSYYRSFSVPAESMAPAFLPGDSLLAKMHDYGPLKRGDIVIVRVGSVDYVKRIVALPGDSISIDSGHIILNGNRIPQTIIPATKTSLENNKAYQYRREKLPGESRSHIVLDMGHTMIDNISEVKLNSNQYYLLGDNRDRSADSRIPTNEGGLDVVSQNQIRGKPLYIFWRQGSGWGEKPI